MYIPHSKEETKSILKTLGLSSLEDLFSHIDPSLLSEPKLLRIKRSFVLQALAHMTE